MAFVIFPRPQVINDLFNDIVSPYRTQRYGIALHCATALAGRMLLSGHDHRHSPPTREVGAGQAGRRWYVSGDGLQTRPRAYAQSSANSNTRP